MTGPQICRTDKKPGPASLLIKKAAAKNAEYMRTKTVEEHREAIQALAEVRPIPPTVHIQEMTCGGVPCELVSREDSRADKIVCYIHGGSWAFGNRLTARAVAVQLAEHTGCRVLVVEYRLSPEHPYPAGLNDCQQVWFWLQQGYYPKDIALYGDSAGGNLALALCHRLDEDGQELPAALMLASPVVDMTGESNLVSLMPDLTHTIYKGEAVDIFSLYAGEADRYSPLLSPIYGDLSKFPPMLIHAGEDEEMCADCERFAQMAHQAGAQVALKIWSGMFHDFSIVGITLKESRESMKECGDFCKKILFSGQS